VARSLEETRAAKRVSMAARRAADPETNRQKQRAWHANNRERSRAKMRDYYARRFFWGRAMKLRSKERASFVDLARLWKSQRGLCALTGERLDRFNAQLDHILPKTRGGGDEATNLRWVTKTANLLKRDLTDEELLLFCANVMRRIGRRIEFVEGLLK
jgi:5-methylcytosine-specific restriction endonuclease McrA